jgi:ariadne-1
VFARVQCNKFNAKVARARGEDNSSLTQDERTMETNRYLFYYQRYFVHEQSKRFAERQRVDTERRMNELHSAASGSALWIDFKYLAEASLAVFRCRQVLKYTYVFAYFLTEGREKTLFEFLQQKLEQATEKLSEMSELPIEQQDKASITNYTRVTIQFMNNLLDGVANGLTSDASA